MPACCTLLVAHLLREIEGAILDVLAPLTETRPGNSDTAHLEKVEAIVAMLGMTVDNTAVVKWISAVSGIAEEINGRARRLLN